MIQPKYIALIVGVGLFLLLLFFSYKSVSFLKEERHITGRVRNASLATLFSLIFCIIAIVLSFSISLVDYATPNCWYAKKIVFPSVSSTCATDTITYDGSTVLKQLVQAAAQSYPQTYCSLETIKSGVGDESLKGLLDVSTSTVDIGDSDVFASPINYANLQDHPVAGVPYAIIVNPSVTKKNFTTEQVQKIYDGTFKNWSRLQIASSPIIVDTRNGGSGSRKTFDTYVTGYSRETPSARSFNSDADIIKDVAKTPGAIGYASYPGTIQMVAQQKLTLVSLDGVLPSDMIEHNSKDYKFWAIEHMYTNPANSAHAQRVEAFIDYIINTPDLAEGQEFLPLSQVKGLLDNHCPASS